MILITGGLGFIGSALARALLARGEKVRIFDNVSRGRIERRPPGAEFVFGDIRNIGDLGVAMEKVDVVFHLASVNGTVNFYRHPGHVLDVGVRGMLNVVQVADHYRTGLLVVSSSEVYQTPPTIPTSEDVPLSIPDPYNPRYSYGAQKILTEMLAIHATQSLDSVVIVRPHNIYGPDMGNEHVIPELVRKIKAGGVLEFQGSEPMASSAGRERKFWGGGQTRAFCHISDAVDGILTAWATGEHLGIYNVGTDEEVRIVDLAFKIADLVGGKVIISEEAQGSDGGTLRRCPDISKLRALGFKPKVSLDEGLGETVRWYINNGVRAAEAVQ